MNNYDGAAGSSVAFGEDGLVPGDDSVVVSAGAFDPTAIISLPSGGSGSGTLHPANLTFEAWIDHTLTGDTLVSGGGYMITTIQDNNGIEANATLTDSSFVYVRAYDTPPYNGGLLHVVMTEDTSWLRLFVNGRLAGQVSTHGESIDYDSGIVNDPVLIGSPGYGAPRQVDELAIYDYALTPAQVESHYYANPNWLHGGPLTDGETRGGGSPTKCFNLSQATLYPVELPSGEFWHTFDDISFPGRGVPISLTHTYSSTLASVNGPLGYGWSMSYDMSLDVDGGSGVVTIHEENGAETTFDPDPMNPGSYVASVPRCSATLVQNMDESWTFTRNVTSEVFTFNEAGQLVSISSLLGDPEAVTTLSYDGNDHLETVTDDAGRTLTFTWTGNHVTGVEDSSSPSRSVSFTYDSNELTDWTDVADGNWHFTYDGSHRLETMRDPRQDGVMDPPVITNHYDGEGRVDSQTDRLDRETTFDYDTIPGGVIVTDPEDHATAQYFNDGLLLKVTRGYGTGSAATTTYRYTPDLGLPDTVIDPNGHFTTFSFDTNGNVTSKTDALNRTMSTSYNEFNEPTYVYDADSQQTTYSYDGNGNLESIERVDWNQDPAVHVLTTYAHEDGSHPSDVTSMTDPNEKTWNYGYDANGNRDSVTDPLGNQTTWVFNTEGWPTSMTSPRGNAYGATPEDFTTHYTYTAFGDVHTIEDPLDQTETRDYDENRNLVSVENRNAHTTTYVYDAEDQLKEMHRPDSTVLENHYWDDGRLKTQIDGANAATGYTYDPIGRLASVTDPLNNTTNYRYDLAGNMLDKQDAGGDCDAGPKTGCTTFTYDDANQLATVTYSDGVTPGITSITYDNLGRRREVVDSDSVSSTWDYDVFGRLTSSDDGTGAIGYGYDPAGNLTTITYPGDHTVTREYDDAERLHTSTDWNSLTTTFDYDEDANLHIVTYPTGDQVDTYTYDHDDRMDTVSMVAGVTTNAALDYDRDDNGQLTGEDLTSLPGSDSTWAYDDLERLTTRNSTTTWAYDDADNLTRTSTGAHQGFNAGNQLCTSASSSGTCASPASPATAYDYDTRGDRTTKTPPSPTPATTYSYDQANRLTAVDTASATYTYNPDGLRTTKTVSSTTTSFAWSKAAALPLVLTETTNSDTTYYLFGPGDIVYAQIAPDSTTTTYLHHDQLGSTRLLTEDDGTPSGAATYDAYGTVTSTGTLSHLGYAGQYTDAETGFQYLQARYYDPATGQFLTRDPAAEATRSAYGFVSGSPLNGRDPQGLCPVDAMLTASSGGRNCLDDFTQVMQRAFRDKRTHGGFGFHGVAERAKDFYRYGANWDETQWQNHVDQFKGAVGKLKEAIEQFFGDGCPPPGGVGGDLFSGAMKLAYGTPVPSRDDVDAYQRYLDLRNDDGFNPWPVVGIVAIGALIIATDGAAAPALAFG